MVKFGGDQQWINGFSTGEFEKISDSKSQGGHIGTFKRTAFGFRQLHLASQSSK